MSVVTLLAIITLELFHHETAQHQQWQIQTPLQKDCFQDPPEEHTERTHARRHPTLTLPTCPATTRPPYGGPSR